MSNYFDGLVNNFLKKQFNDAINEIIRAFQVNCKFYYPQTKWVACDNCSNSIEAASPNPYLHGKPSTGCLVCGGTSKIAIETSEDAKLAIIFNYKKFQEIAGQILVPQGDAQTLSNMSMATKIKTCKYVIFDTDREYYNSHKFQRMNEPVPLGMGDFQFLLTTWEVAG